MRRVGLSLLLAVVATAALAAQEFHPPPVRSAGDGTRLGLLGFGVRGGIDLSGKTQLVFGGVNSYVGSLEGLYRFTGEGQAVTPYAGGGFSLVGHDRCGADPDCPDVWLNVVLGFELHYRSTFNWLLEYHGMGGFRHNRFYAGLTTRRGN